MSDGMQCSLRMILLGVFLCLGCCFPTLVQAQDGNYIGLPIGLRAVGMGGAYTAIADDPTAGYYNPAGLALMKREQVSLGMRLYGLEYRQVDGGFARANNSIDLRRLSVIFTASNAGASVLFGNKDENGRPLWGGSFAILVPSVYRHRFRNGASWTDQSKDVKGIHIAHRDDDTFLIGPSLAKRWGNFSIGMSAFAAYRGFSWLLLENDASSQCPGGDPGRCQVVGARELISSVEGYTAGLNFRVGLLWRVLPTWRLGISASLSSIPVLSAGDLILQQGSIPRRIGNRPIYSEELGLEVGATWPWMIRLGNAVEVTPRLLLSLDLVAYLPQRYNMLETQRPMDVFQSPNQVDRSFVMNAHFGGEYNIADRVPIRWGLFTNFSSAPNIPEKTLSAYLAQRHQFGATLGFGFKLGPYRMDVGVSLAYSIGHTQRLVPSENWSFERVPLQEYSGTLFIAGVAEVGGYALRKMMNTVRNQILKQQDKDKQRIEKSSLYIPKSRPSKRARPLPVPQRRTPPSSRPAKKK